MSKCTPKTCNLEIPHSVIDRRYVDGKDTLKNFPGHYVTVREEGSATYHVTHPGINCLPNATLVAPGLLYRDGFDPDLAPEYKNTRVLDFSNNREYIYDYAGDVRFVTLQEVA